MLSICTISFVCIEYCNNYIDSRSRRLREPLIKSHDPSRKIQESVILFMLFFRYRSLRHLLPSLLTFAKKKMPRRRPEAAGNGFVGPVYPYRGFQAIVQAVPRPCIKFHLLFSPSRVPLSSSVGGSTQNAAFELHHRKRAACETRVRAAPRPMLLTH